jgi:hypothetical protein
MPTFVRRPAAALCLVALALSAAARAQTPWHEGFETGQPSWQDAGGNTAYRLVQQQRVQQNAHTGNGSEWLQIEGGEGKVYFAHDLGRPRVIDELAPSLWVKSDRAGLQLALRVVLPRTQDPRSGRPVTTILAGPFYSDVNRWQRLQMAGLPTLLNRQIQLLHMQLGPQVDGREAYLDALLLNVNGGPGVTNVWIDDLDVNGYAATETRSPQQAGVTQTAAIVDAGAAKSNASPATAAGPLVPVRLPPVQAASQAPVNDRAVPALAPPSQPAPAAVPEMPAPSPADNTPPQHRVKLDRSVLLVDDRPWLPRVIQHRGEPLAVLKKLGFNTVWLQRLPAPEILEEANRLGLWVICPPPRALGPMAEIGAAFDCVLAWDLGSDLGTADLEATQHWADEVRTADHRGQRPLVCRPRSEFRRYSRSADLLLIDRRPLGTSLELTDYAAWIRRQPLLARPGTPVWTTVQTQPNESLRQQLMALEPGATPPLSVPSEQVRLLAYIAVASGSRGLVFVSDSPLDAPDPETQQRAMTLELLNLELALIEPWAAAGSMTATAESNQREVIGSVLHTEHTNLLLPIWCAPKAQCVPPQSAANSVSLVVPGVPEASEAYELSPSGLLSLPSKRVAGGMRVTFDEFGPTTQVLLAHDPLIIGEVRRRAIEFGRRMGELQRNLAVHKLNTVQALAGQLAPRTRVDTQARWLDSARNYLQTCDRQLAAGDTAGASQNAQRATRSLRLLERAYWDAATKGLASTVASPAAISFDTLPYHWRLVDRLAGCRFGPSRIAGGDFEDLDTMVRAGWRYVPNNVPNVQATADLAPGAARSGRFGLRLAAVAADPKNPPAAFESPPVLFTSPSVQVDAGQVVCVYGWVYVSTPITATADGLLIVDSLGGEALAERVNQTKGWQQFALYRVAPQSGSICVTFALTGLGEARLDDVAIQVTEGPAAVTQR